MVMIDISTGLVVKRGQVIRTPQGDEVIVTHVFSTTLLIQPANGGHYQEIVPGAINIRIEEDR